MIIGVIFAKESYLVSMQDFIGLLTGWNDIVLLHCYPANHWETEG
jgi:hypothetical protein